MLRYHQGQVIVRFDRWLEEKRACDLIAQRGRGDGRRLHAALPVIQNGNTELLRLVGKIAGDAGAGEDHDAGRHDLQHAVVLSP